MPYTFTLTTKPTTPFLKKLAALLQKTPPITTEKAYNQLIHEVVTLAKQYPLPKNQGRVFAKELKQATRLYPLSEPTEWGGVALKQVDVGENYIKKLLVVKQYGTLGFEIHKEKLEKLKILEGLCLLLMSHHKKKNWEKGKVLIQFGKPEETVSLIPGDEHGVIALTNCVIEETSTNHLTDLHYIFKAAQVA